MKKVIIGMSGGVDSTAAAIILKEQGYDVIGISFKFIDNFDDSEVKEICNKLNIEHHTIDYRKEFKEEIINKFINDYKFGLTPNPCVICNKKCKFKFLFDQMEKYKANYIATGHYAIIKDNKIYKSSDLNKDQTYFLNQLSKDEISKIIFPLEGYNKEDIRNIVKTKNINNYNKKDSYDVCFINEKFRNYISKEIKNVEGPIIDIKTNKILGNHKGLSNYTIGQRKGLNIGGTQERLFVVGKNIKENILFVAQGNNEYLYSDSCIIKDINFNCEEKIFECNAKFRYKSQEVKVKLEYLSDNEILVKYEKTKSVTPGQSCVFYKNNQMIGGGTIKEVRKENEKLWYLL